MSSMKKVLSIFMVLLMILTCTSVVAFADNDRSGNLSRDYTWSSDQGQLLANVALAQKGKTGSTLGYTEDWCADFVTDCAKVAGLSDIIPKWGGYGGVSNLAKYVKDCGGYKTSNPRVGDLVLYDWNTNNSPDHIEILYETDGYNIKTIGGNTGSTGNYRTNYVSTHVNYNVNSKNVYEIIHPNYSGSSTPAPSTNWDFSKPSTYPSYGGYLQVGSTDDGARRVSFLQTSLNYLGFDCGNVDGQFGSATKEQVKNFQAAVGVEVDGIVGPTTWDKLIQRVGLNDIGTDFWIYLIMKKDWKHLENSASSNVQIAANGNDNNDPKQIWHVERTSEGRYKFRNAYDDKMLDLYGANAINGNGVQTWEYHGDTSQQWIVAYSLDGEGYCIRTACGDTVLDSYGGWTSAGNNIQVWEYNSSDAQKFVFYTLATDNVYYSKPAKPSAPTLSVKAGSTTTFSWTNSPLKDSKYDSREYVLRIWKGSSTSGDVFVRKDLSANTLSCNIDLADGTYTATVLAKNAKYSGYNTSSNAVTFTVKSCTHSWKWVVDKAATCKATGLKHEECANCKEKRNQNTVIPLASHNEVIDKAVAATCSSTGLTEGKHCSVCGAVLVAQKTVEKTNHSYTSSVTTQPTCTKEGVRTYKCACGVSYTESIEKIAHTDGNSDGKCDNCGAQTGTATPTDPSKNCSCNCHKTGITKFFFTLINFFQKLFGQNKVCACGVKH